MCVESSKLHGIKKWQSIKQTIEVSIKTFCRTWERETLPQWFFIFKQLDKCQNEYYSDNLNLISLCRRISLHVLMFPIFLLKRNLWSYWKWQTPNEKIWPFFIPSKNRGLFSSLHICFLYLLTRIFFQECIEMELKFFYIIFEGFFEWQK